MNLWYVSMESYMELDSVYKQPTLNDKVNRRDSLSATTSGQAGRLSSVIPSPIGKSPFYLLELYLEYDFPSYKLQIHTSYPQTLRTF
jgi:hypothetical protein